MKVFGKKKFARNRTSIQNGRAINRSPVNFYTVSLAMVYQFDIHRVAPVVYLSTMCGGRWVNFCDYGEWRRIIEKTKLCKISLCLRKYYLRLPERV